MSRLILGMVLAAFSSALLATPAVPDYCEARLLSPHLGPSGYRYRPDQRACEGTWDRRVQGSRTLRIVSLFTPAPPNSERPAVFWPGTITRSTRILVQSLRDDIPYRLDAQWLPSEPSNFSWNGAVLRTLGLSANELGVLAYEQIPSGERLYIAVAARLPQPTQAPAHQRNSPELHVTLLPPFDLRNVKLAVRAADEALTSLGQGQTAAALPAGLPRTFLVPAPRARGEYVLAISAELADHGSPISLLARFRR